MNPVRDLPVWLHALVFSPPRRGEGLNLWFFKVARSLHAFRSPDDIVHLLRAATADQTGVVKHGEIERAVENSAKVVWQPGQLSPPASPPCWPNLNTEQREAVIAEGYGLVDLWELSPIRFEDNDAHTEEIIDALFPADPLLCVGRSDYQFSTQPREDWRGRLDAMQFIVPSPMSARIGLTQGGKESAHALTNTGPRRFLVVEQDHDTVDEQASVLLHLAKSAPLALVVHSGGKSIHGWFMAVGQQEDRLRRFMEAAVALGADPATWTRSQFVRMPGGIRDTGERQVIYFFNPGNIR